MSKLAQAVSALEAGCCFDQGLGDQGNPRAHVLPLHSAGTCDNPVLITYKRRTRFLAAQLEPQGNRQVWLVDYMGDSY